MDTFEEIVLVPEGLCEQPKGRFVLNGREVGVYRCEEEREIILHEFNEQIVLTE